MKIPVSILFILSFALAQTANAGIGLGFRLSGGISMLDSKSSIGSAELYLDLPATDHLSFQLGFNQSSHLVDSYTFYQESKLNSLQTRLVGKLARFRPWVGAGIGSKDVVEYSGRGIDRSEIFDSFWAPEAGLEFLLVDRDSFKLGLYGQIKNLRDHSTEQEETFQEYGLSLLFTPSPRRHEYRPHHSTHYHSHVYLDPDVLFGVARIMSRVAPKIVDAIVR